MAAVKRIALFSIILLLVLAVLASCGDGKASVLAEGEVVPMRHATLLRMRRGQGYTYVGVVNPWDTTAVLHSYVLVPREAGELPASLPEGDVVRTPVESAVVYSVVHCSLLEELGAYGAISGVCDLRYMSHEGIRRDVARGRIRNVGESSAPNVEALMELSPGAILLSPYQDSGSYGRLSMLGVPLVECADYMETSPLGRAEWMRFYGLLFGRGEEADSLFGAVEREYERLHGLAARSGRRPSVVVDMKYGNTWYVAGGGSTTGRLLRDAAAAYVYADTDASGSLPLAPEAVFERAMDAEFWLVRYAQSADKTYAEIAQEYANYARMRAFRTRNIYACNTDLTPFYAETPFHPHLLLREYMKILHPELLPNDTLRYYHRLTK